jgi:glycine/D-amino acid oxidase-like deaminating enzyme
MGTIIIGGGIIGTSVAYYLSEVSGDPSSIHIVESSSRLFSSASGYAAGFLAKDWFSPAAAELGTLSFELHKRLAEKHDGGTVWGYALSTALSLAIQEGVGVGTGERGEDWLLNGTSRAEVSAGNDFLKNDGTPAWLTKQEGGTLDVISSENGCAQVDPLRLCEFMMEACRARGVQLHHPAQVVSLNKDKDGALVGVNLVSDGCNVPGEIECKNIVIASGAWTPAVFKKLFHRSNISIPISPLAGYSLLIKSPRHSLLDEEKYGRSHAVFSAPTKTYSWAPEIFSRRGGDIYIAGLNDPSLPLPEHATGAVVKYDSVAEMNKVAVQLLGRAIPKGDEISENDLEVTREALCFRPVAKRGTPIITRVPDSGLGKGTKSSRSGGVFIATGHGPWVSSPFSIFAFLSSCALLLTDDLTSAQGISLSLGTGKVVAEMIRGEKTSANVSRLGL